MARTPLLDSLARALRGAGHAASGGAPPWTRRAVLQAGAGWLASGALAGCGGSQREVFSGRDPRVAIIGAGLAGCHCAWRLAERQVPVHLFEASDRIGGRAWSAPSAGSQVMELGGEIIDLEHEVMLGLAAELEIPLDEVTAQAPGARAIWYFEGREVPEAELAAAWRPVAAQVARAVAAAELSEGRFEALDRQSIPEWLTAAGCDPLLQRVIEVVCVGEFGLDPEAQSALNLIYRLGPVEAEEAFDSSGTRYHARPGTQAFVERLHAKLPRPATLGHRLTRVRQAADGRYRLDFDTPGGPREEVFEQVVFALPFTLLRQVALEVELPAAKRAVIETLGYGSHSKLMMGTSRRVWRLDHAASGNVTAEGDLQHLWDTSQGQPSARGILTNFVGGARGVAIGAGEAQAQAAQVLAQVEAVFPGTRAAFSGEVTRMHWPSAPFAGGSYACYRPGQWALHGSEGARVGNLHFCGEHTSVDFQGYLEGAAETGAAVAQAILAGLGLGAGSGALRALGSRQGLAQPAWEGLPAGRLPVLARRQARAALRGRLRC